MLHPGSTRISNLALKGSMIAGFVFVGMALIALVFAEGSVFFALAVIGLVFIGLGWAGKHLFEPAENQNAGLNAGLIAGIIFGGVGLMMLIGSIALFIDGEFGGAIGLAVFGIVFCAAGYAGKRVFSVPSDKKRILVSSREQIFSGNLGQKGRRISRHYVYVDKDKSPGEIEKQQQEWAEKPWTQRSDWAAGMVMQDGPGSMTLLTGFTIVWNLIANSIAALALITSWDSGDVPWFVLVFPLFGLALIIMTVRTWIRRRKFGISILHLNTLPAIPGRFLGGTIAIEKYPSKLAASEFKIKMNCYERSSYYDEKHERRVSEKALWSHEDRVFGGRINSAGKLEIPVKFALPAEMPPTSLIPDDDRVLWRLEVSAATSGVDYAVQFEVPVYSLH